MTKTAAIYTRISLDQSGEGAGVARQEKECRDLAESLGYTVTAVHCDNSVSAYSGKRRPAFEALLEEPVDAFIVWALDRLYRQPRDLETIIDRLGTRIVHAVTSGALDLSTSEGKLTARIVGAVAAAESEIKSRRIKARKRSDKERGAYLPGGRRPFGWEWTSTVPDGPRKGRPAGPLAIVPEEAAAFIKGAEMLLDGQPLIAVRDMFHERGVKTSGGSDFDHTSLRQTYMRAMNVGTPKHPGLISKEQHASIVAMLTSRRATSREGSVKSLLSGLLRCGGCGGKVYASGRGYRCFARGCASISRPALDQLICELVSEALKHVQDPGPVEPERISTEAQVEALQARLESFQASATAGDLDPADFIAIATPLRAQIRELLKPVPEARRAGFTESWDNLDEKRRRAAIAEVILLITIAPAKTGTRPPVHERVTVAWV